MPLDILSLGTGVQSTTVLLMSCRGILPKLDAAVFADTQWEPKAVYRHLKWLKPESERHGIPVHITTRGNLREDAIKFFTHTGKDKGAGDKDVRWASLPMYTKDPETGKVGLIRRQCTSEYKIEAVERVIRYDLLGLKKGQMAPADGVRHWFGISQDEVQRKRKSMTHWETLYYPLIDTVRSPKCDTLLGRGFDRKDCLDWLKKNGYPEPPRSSCIGCPFHSDLQWLRLQKEDPEAWADAVEFDRIIREGNEQRRVIRGLELVNMKQGIVGAPYLHRSCVPLDQVKFNPRDRLAASQFGMSNECAGVCGV